MFIKSPRDYISYSTHKIYIFFLNSLKHTCLYVCLLGSIVVLRSSCVCTKQCSVRWIPPVLCTNNTDWPRSLKNTLVTTHTHSEIIVKHLSTSHYFCCAFLFLNYMFSFCMCACVWAELQKVPREVFAVDPAHSSSSEASYRCRKCRWKMEAECFKLHVSLIWISWWHTQKQNSLLSWWFYFLAQQSTV